MTTEFVTELQVGPSLPVSSRLVAALTVDVACGPTTGGNRHKRSRESKMDLLGEKESSTRHGVQTGRGPGRISFSPKTITHFRFAASLCRLAAGVLTARSHTTGARNPA